MTLEGFESATPQTPRRFPAPARRAPSQGLPRDPDDLDPITPKNPSMTQASPKNDGGSQRPQNDLTRLRKLGELMKEFDWVELVIEPDGGVKLRRREDRAEASPVPWFPPVPAHGERAVPPVAPPAAMAAPPAETEPPRQAGLVEMKSPIVGTFYRASAPDKEPFCEKGTRVKPDSVVCIIEAMKVMNEIRAEMSGEVVEVLVKNGEAVEFNQPLFLIRPE